MKTALNFLNLGVRDYKEVLELQKKLVELRIENKIENTIILVEHPHVFTIGRKLKAEDHILEKTDIPVVEVERGGDVTYHGPGQYVAYPIIHLESNERDLDFYLRTLEKIIINTVKKWGIKAQTVKNQTGVWVGEKKLASIGIAVKKWVTFHGFALNVSNDLSYFLKIKPCGLDGNVMTSLKEITTRNLQFEEINYYFIRECEIAFSGRARFVTEKELLADH